MGDDEYRQGFVAADQALTDQVLMEFAGFGGKGAGDAGNAAVGERCHAREIGLAIDQVGRADRMILHAQQQGAPSG